MKHWKMWGVSAALIAVVALFQAGCATRFDDVSTTDTMIRDSGDASPYTDDTDYPGRPVFPPHTEAP